MTRAIMRLYRERCVNWRLSKQRALYTRDEIRTGSIYSAESRWEGLRIKALSTMNVYRARTMRGRDPSSHPRNNHPVNYRRLLSRYPRVLMRYRAGRSVLQKRTQQIGAADELSRIICRAHEERERETRTGKRGPRARVRERCN